MHIFTPSNAKLLIKEGKMFKILITEGKNMFLKFVVQLKLTHLRHLRKKIGPKVDLSFGGEPNTCLGIRNLHLSDLCHRERRSRLGFIYTESQTGMAGEWI